MRNIIGLIAKGLMLSGMSTLPFALYFGETQKSMSLELNYLLLGAVLFTVGFFIDAKILSR